MSRFLLNWTYQDVVSFLRQHFFVEIPSGRTGHSYFKGLVNGEYTLVEVQFHPNGKTISPRSLQHDIIPKSKIPEVYWKEWANAGNKKARRKIQYQQAKNFQ